MNILLNLLAGTDGGQITRAKAFLERVEQMYPNIHLTILKDASVLNEVEPTERRKIMNVDIGNRQFKALKRMIWENFTLPKLVEKQSPDLFLTFSHYLPFKNLKIPSLVGVSNLAPFSSEFLKDEPLLNRFRIFLLKKSIISSTKKANGVLALSQACKDILIQHGIDQKKIIVSHNGIEPEWAKIESNSQILIQNKIQKPYLLYVSHFYRYKNHKRLIDAFNRFQRSKQNDIKLVLVGKPKDESYFNEILLYVKNHDVKNRIQIIAGVEREELKSLYQNAELFIFPSLVENSPNILLEAMMSAAPVATSSQPPMPEHCGDAALYFDGYQTSEIESVIIEALSDSEKLENMRSKSLERAALFSWDRFTADLIDQIELILN